MHCWYAVLVCCCSAVACAGVKLGMHMVETLLVRVTAPAYCAVSLLPVLSCGDAEPLSGKLKLRGGVAALAAVSVTEHVGYSCTRIASHRVLLPDVRFRPWSQGSQQSCFTLNQCLLMNTYYTADKALPSLAAGISHTCSGVRPQ
jgi:hypothetical protein